MSWRMTYGRTRNLKLHFCDGRRSRWCRDENKINPGRNVYSTWKTNRPRWKDSTPLYSDQGSIDDSIWMWWGVDTLGWRASCCLRLRVFSLTCAVNDETRHRGRLMNFNHGQLPAIDDSALHRWVKIRFVDFTSLMGTKNERNLDNVPAHFFLLRSHRIHPNLGRRKGKKKNKELQHDQGSAAVQFPFSLSVNPLFKMAGIWA